MMDVSQGRLDLAMGIVETTATGAAILAAVGSGIHPTVSDAVDAFVAYEPGERQPDPGAAEATTRRTGGTATSTAR